MYSVISIISCAQHPSLWGDGFIFRVTQSNKWVELFFGKLVWA